MHVTNNEAKFLTRTIQVWSGAQPVVTDEHLSFRDEDNGKCLLSSDEIESLYKRLEGRSHSL